ncbi:MPT63 family protein [Mycolicibacterium cosmeticum]|uniref:MPT63 family protein n=1 Tax=Mycolicibacterium cosmeticum TaxID=258533 RepID=UPI001DC1E451|nr:MPT63 family protein [Mycobacterium sp.]MCB0943601.1 MPT63 family protein [Mycobacterium sp.]MCB1286285.1 MPT63 family protein [Mycobacterium sp.]
MKITTVLATTAAAAGIGVLSAPIALADNPTPNLVTLGQPAELINGSVVQAWTISGLKPSSDVIPWHVRGALWEATATNTAVAGTVQPIVSDLNARARNGDTYRTLFLVATPQGVNPAALAQGQQTSGKIYFDVTGAQPDSVVYNDGARDLAVWLTPPPAPPAPAAGGSAPYRGTPSASSPAQDTEAAPAAVPPAAETPMTPAPASVGTPLTPGSVGTPLPTGSAGTPLPTGDAVAPGGTPAPAGSPSVTTTPDISTGTPLPAETPAPATAAAPAPTATPAGSAGTPLPAPEVAPAAGAATPAAPVTTTPVPMP